MWGRPMQNDLDHMPPKYDFKYFQSGGHSTNTAKQRSRRIYWWHVIRASIRFKRVQNKGDEITPYNGLWV